MTLFRSVFWLFVAFLVIGPHFDYSDSVLTLSQQAMDSGQQLLIDQTDMAACSSIECVGTKMVVSAGVNSIGSLIQSTMEDRQAAQPQVIAPQPHARINRLG